jgi:hypothetical protein
MQVRTRQVEYMERERETLFIHKQTSYLGYWSNRQLCCQDPLHVWWYRKVPHRLPRS